MTLNQQSPDDPGVEDVAIEVGARIHTLMWRKKISQATAGEAIGVNQSTFSKKIRGVTALTVSELCTLAQLLDVNAADLLPRLDSNQQPSGYPFSQVSEVTDLAEWRQRRAS